MADYLIESTGTVDKATLYKYSNTTRNGETYAYWNNHGDNWEKQDNLAIVAIGSNEIYLEFGDAYFISQWIYILD